MLMQILHTVIKIFATIIEDNFMKNILKYVFIAVISCFVSIGTWEAMHVVSGVDGDLKEQND